MAEIIRDNYEQLRFWLIEQKPNWKPYEIYHLMWLCRRKDGMSDKDSTVSKHWYIHSVDELDKLKPSLLEYAAKGGRITLGINRKDLRRVNAELNMELSYRALDDNYPLAPSIFPSIVDKSRPCGRGSHFIDVDRLPGETDDAIRDRMELYANCLYCDCFPKNESKRHWVVPSKTGYHILFDRCNYQPLLQKYTVDVKKDEPTNLFIAV